ncbi:MAG TPA: P1 family peptidase [Ottowia sp.]|uniref:P1 family peptidase n=1 Tax=Ottowia sp. TaxID=1898956 RepID=UPI002CE212EC|nr:P1 family peptidase [Ottowia sp.]HNR84159.1 P1 family peptidase [Ottowia sp.]HNT85615.1 P1 family peptidase [Ottowia sp.]HOZ94085.1 P1 family peptidase [Ottowia sp.]HQO52359.1 P1 family peptidase [Ottowia sp.]HQQ53157.1 P1 family peptidase [Ottowia sp.]
MTAVPALPYAGTLTDVQGIEVGHFTDPRRPTGCSVVLARAGAVGGVDVRGAAPGTRETDLLDPANLVGVVHAVLLAGGSAWGLDAAGGVMRWLEEQGIGLPVGGAPGQIVPIVPAAVLFDLHVGDARIRPDAAAGHAACQAAGSAPPAQGNVGAGAGATVGKLFGAAHAMKGGIGSAAVSVDGVTVGALIAVNALGDVVDPASGRPIAGARSADGRLHGSVARALAGERPLSLLSGTQTTIGVIATDAPLTKAQCQRLAGAGHDGLARAIRPVHTMSDGDTLFALATGQTRALDFNVLCSMAGEAVARACVNAVQAARSLSVAGVQLPAAIDIEAAGASLERAGGQVQP